MITRIREKKETGFSLLELSVAVGVAAIVASAGIVATTAFIGSAQDKRDSYTANADNAIEDAESSSIALGLTPIVAASNTATSSVGTDSATITWDAPANPVGSFTILVDGNLVGEDISGSATSYTLTGLDAGTTYNVVVRSVGSNGTADAQISVETSNIYTASVWGRDYYSQSTIPAEATNLIDISSGSDSIVAVKSDGTIIGWGGNSYMWDVPAGENNNFVEVSAGPYHALGLKNDGTVVAWGMSEGENFGQVSVPAGLSDVTAVSAGLWHNLALKSDGTVVAWGYNGNGETNVPAGLTNVVDISAPGYYSLAVKSDGTVVAWGGDNHYYDGSVTVPAGLTDVVAVDGSWVSSAALKSDGTVVEWDIDGIMDRAPAGLNEVTDISVGGLHVLALKSDGTVVAWGSNGEGESTVPTGLSDVWKISASHGGDLSVALIPVQ